MRYLSSFSSVGTPRVFSHPGYSDVAKCKTSNSSLGLGHSWPPKKTQSIPLKADYVKKVFSPGKDINMSLYLIVIHVFDDGVHSFLKLSLVLVGVTVDVPYVTDEDGEHKHPHQPGGCHKQNLGCVGRLFVFSDRCRSLGCEIKTPARH